ncbi:Hydrogenase maturation factor [Burkholderia multivorans]
MSDPDMSSTYNYRGYTIEVRCEHMLDQPADDTKVVEPHSSYVAVVQVRAGHTSSISFSPVRLADSSGRAFTESLDALSAGRAAGEVIVDELLGG